MFTRESPVVAVAPSISREQFRQILIDHNSPAAFVADPSYDRIIRYNVDPLFALGIFLVESQMATHPESIEVLYDCKNPGMRRTTRNGKGTTIYPPERGRTPYQRYRTWADGWDDLAFSLTEPGFEYQRRGLTTPESILPVWAPGEDDNDPERYITTVVTFMNTHRGTMSNVNEQFLRRLQDYGIEVHDIRGRMPTNGSYPRLGPGWRYLAVHYTGVWRERNTLQADINSWVGHARFHVNSQRWPGIAYNVGISPSGRVFLLKGLEFMGYHAFNTNSIAAAVSCDTTNGQVLTPEMEKSLQAVLLVLEEVLPNYHRSRTWDHNGFQWHDRRNANTLCAGTFIRDRVDRFRSGQVFLDIRPQTVDPDPTHAYIKQTDKWIVGNIFKRWSEPVENVLVFGFPLTGMTGNDRDGYVQVFERAIMHHRPGTWPDRYDVHLERVGVEIARRKGLDNLDAFKRADDPKRSDVRYFPETGQFIYGRWKGFWEEFGGLDLFGLPISGIFVDPETGLHVQYFERARFEYHPGFARERYGIMLGRLGAEVLRLREKQDQTESPTDLSTTHTVVAGDTLSAIALQHGVSLQAILDVNPDITNPNRIFPGQVINIPR